MVIPLAMGLLAPDGQEMPTRLEGEPAAVTGTRVLLVTEAEQSFTFTDMPAPPVPSLLRNFSAPVKLSGVSRDRLRFLAAHDSDPFVRWESGQQYAAGLLLEMTRADPEVEPGLIEAMAACLAQADADPAFAAETLSLPGEAFLADQMKVADFDEIHAARDATRAAIGRALAEEFRATYDRLAETGEYRIDGAAIGRRALRNICLAYLVAADIAGAVALAKAQFDAGRNMTDVLAALSVLNGVDCRERNDALAAFHAAWRADELVLDKWFAIQAVSPLPGTLAAVRALTEHEDFDWKNPNRVRAVIASFASGNQVRFHEASGAGYRFLAETVKRLDPINGQIAARLVQPLGQWRRTDPGRQTAMRAALADVLALPGLSKGTYEMVSKSLETSDAG